MPIEDDEPITPLQRAQADRGAALISAAVAATRAPQSLREAIESDRSRAAARPGRRHVLGRRLLGPAGVPVVLAAVVALVVWGESVSTNDGEGGRPLVTTVASLSLRGPGNTVPKPVGSRLNVSVQGVSFPNWAELRWHATGRRTDTVNARRVVTVFYSGPRGTRLGYSIVSGPRLAAWPYGRDVRRGHDTYRITHHMARTTVVWTQQGHTCVVNAPSTVPDERLVGLAATESV